jgi:hypothetical protein
MILISESVLRGEARSKVALCASGKVFLRLHIKGICDPITWSVKKLFFRCEPMASLAHHSRGVIGMKQRGLPKELYVYAIL